MTILLRFAQQLSGAAVTAAQAVFGFAFLFIGLPLLLASPFIAAAFILR